MTENTKAPPTDEGIFVGHSSSSEQHVATTIFKDDTIGTTSTIVEPVGSQFRSFARSKATPGTSDIKSFLERPTQMSTGNFSAANTGILASGNLSALLNSYKTSRMFGMYALRFNLKFTLQVNADRFQQGRYLLVFLPMGGGQVLNQTGRKQNMNFAHLTTITQLPRVELDLAKQTSVTLEVPFMYNLPALEYSSTSNGFLTEYGIWAIVTYSPLATGSGGTTAPWTLWGSFQDIDFTSVSVNQMDTSTVEANKQNIGPMSSTVSRMSRAIGVWGAAPVIGSLAKDVSWYTSMLARSMSIMGWSKPINLAAPTKMVRQVLPYSAVADVSTESRPIGVMSTNSVVSKPDTGTDLDEMAIEFIASRAAYYTTINWAATATAQTLLFECDVKPNTFYNTWSKGVVLTPVAFLHSLANWWRGGFIFRFKLVKTEFHRGRLLVAFSPYSATSTSPSITYAQTELVFREIIDISSTSEFEVCVPYMVVKNWTRFGWTIGRFAMFVENPLTAPSSVATTIPILMEVKGDSDFEIAGPVDTAWELYSPSTTQMAEPYVETPCVTLGSKSSMDEIVKYTIGERITSLRQLTRRNFGFNTTTANIPAGQSLITRGYATWVTSQAATTAGALSRPNLSCDFINLVQGLYAFSTGSMRYRAKMWVSTFPVGVNTNPAPTNFSLQANIAGTGEYFDKTIVYPDIEGIVDVQLPVWQPGLGRSFVDQLEGSNISAYVNPTYGNPTSFTLSVPQNSAQAYLSMYRTAGDDFNCYVWTGVPALVYSYVT